MLQRHSGPGWLMSGIPLYLFIYLLLLRKQQNKVKFSLFFWYSAMIIDLTLFPIPFGSEAFLHIQNEHTFSISLTLLTGTSFLQNFLNTAFFIPFGFLLPNTFPKLKLPSLILIVFLSTLFIELTQLITSYYGYNVRIFDVDDLFCNFIGGLIGILVYKGFTKLFKKI